MVLDMDDVQNEVGEKDFTLDIKGTLFRNLLWIPMFIVVVIVSIMALGYVNSLQEEVLRLMFLIFVLFFVLKLFHWVGHPTIVMKEKEHKSSKK